MRATLMDMETHKPQTTGAPLDSEHRESDETLADRFQTENDSSAMEELIRRHQNMAYRAALACTRNADLAEEAVQEALMSFTQKRNRFIAQGVSSFRGWLYRIVCNQAKMILRREAGERRRALNRRYRDRTAETVGVVKILNLEEEETGVILNEALLSLREEIRAPITLQFVEGMTPEEIAGILGVSRQMVQKRVALGLDLLRKRLAKSGVTAGAVALPTLFANATPTIAPASLVEFLKQLATDPSAFAPTAAVSQSVRAASFWSSSKAILAAVGIVLCAGIVGVWRLTPAKQKSENTVEARSPTPTPTPISEERDATNAAANRFYHRWTFAEGPPDQFEVIHGNWHWQRGKDGIGRMAVGKVEGLRSSDGKETASAGVVLKPRMRMPDKPFFVTVKVCAEKAFTGGFDACWANGKDQAPHLTASRHSVYEFSIGEITTYRAMFVGRFVCTADDKDHRAFTAFAKERASDEILLGIGGTNVQEIEMGELSPELAAKWERSAQEVFGKDKLEKFDEMLERHRRGVELGLDVKKNPSPKSDKEVGKKP